MSTQDKNQKETPSGNTKKQRSFPWGSSLLIIFLILGFIFLYYNTTLLDFMKPKDDAQWELQRVEIRENRLLLREALTQLEEVRSELKDIRTNQGFMLKKLEDTKEVVITPRAETTLSQAIKNLRYQIETAKPFLKEFKAVKSILDEENQNKLDPIEDYCKIGVPKAEFLEEEFEEVEKSLLAEETGGGSWLDKLITRFKNLVTVTKKGDDQHELKAQLEDLKKLVSKHSFELALLKSKELGKSTASKETWELHLQAYIDSRNVLQELETIDDSQAIGDE